MIIKPPQKFPVAENDGKRWVFLAGSIEMDTAEEWQHLVTMRIDADYNIMNPRRAAWDNSWEQTFENPQFSQQVNWELDMLDRADIIIMHFDPKTKSPISLLELGLFAKSGNLLVSCPDGFWRKGNVEIICDRYQIPMYHTLKELIDYLTKNN